MKKSLFVFFAVVLVLLAVNRKPHTVIHVAAKASPAPLVSTTPSPTPKPTPKPFELSDISWMDTPRSTCFSRVGYAKEYNVLGVVFRNSDPRIYLYYDFPSSEWEAFTGAESLGKYYNANIKGQYSGERID